MLEDYSICANSCLGGLCYKMKHIQYPTPYVGAQISHSDMLYVLADPYYYCSASVGEDAVYEGKKQFRHGTHVLRIRDIRVFIPEEDKDSLTIMETWKRRAARAAGKKPAIFIQEHGFYKDLGYNKPYNIEAFLSGNTFIDAFNACPIREKFLLCARVKTCTSMKQAINPACVIDCTAHTSQNCYAGWVHGKDDRFVNIMSDFLR